MKTPRNFTQQTLAGMSRFSFLKTAQILPLALILILGWLLGGCRPTPPNVPVGQGNLAALPREGAPQPGSQPRTLREDRQGAVVISVAPMEATGDSGNLLVFAVSMNTHSVDLSMDLADLSTLAADTGQVLQAMSWTGGSGHHVQGQLAFPSYLDDGTPLLEGATEITLTLRGVDAEERTFVWRVSELP